MSDDWPAIVAMLRSNPTEASIRTFVQQAPDAMFKALREPTIELHVRLFVAVELIELRPLDRKHVHPILEAVLADLSKSQRLRALFELDCRVEASPLLDDVVQLNSEKVQLRCPRCPSIMSFGELVAHLWEVHRLRYSDGFVADPTEYVSQTINDAATSGDPVLYDCAYLESQHFFPDAEPRLVFQSLVARGANDAEQIELLLQLAQADGAGVCSYCLSNVEVALPELLPPLSIRKGRISGEGYSVELRSSWFETEIRIEAPGSATETLPLPNDPLRGRQLAGSVATGFGLLTLFILIVVALPTWATFTLGIFGGIVMTLWFFLKKPKTKATAENQLIDLTWQYLVPGIGRSESATRFLLRLCRTSLTRGQANQRQSALDEVIEQTSYLVQRRAVFAQLNAMARFVRLIDWSQPGPDRYQAVFTEMTQLFREKLSLVGLETMAAVILNERIILPTERLLLARVAISAAFEAGFRPADLMMFFRFVPRFAELCTPIDRDWVNLLYQLWRYDYRNNSERLEMISLFRLIEQEPRLARQQFRETPLLLWMVSMPDHYPDSLQHFTLQAEGLAYDGKTICTDPEQLTMNQKGSTIRCNIGSLALNVPSSMASALMALLQQNLTLWQELTRRADQRDGSDRLRPESVTMLQTLAVHCPLCQSEALHQPGRMGTPWQAILNQQTDSASA